MLVPPFIKTAVLIILAACGGSEPPPEENQAGGSVAADGECRMLTAADVKELTGADVMPVRRGSIPGAGGTCGNYATADGNAFLGINELASTSEFRRSVDAVPSDAYPNKQSVGGLGDEAVLFTDGSGAMKYLVARKGSRGAAIFPVTAAISDEQLRALGERALGGL